MHTMPAMGEAENERESKAALRARMRAARAALSAEEREAASRRVEERVMALPAVGRARTVLLFASFGSEVATAGMVDRLLAAGKRVLLPFLDGGAMEAAAVEPGEAMVATSYGPREPAGRKAADPGEVDLVIAPGLAFDRSGNRIGYGGAFYDRYLRRIPAMATRIGVGFAVQVVDEVPTAEHDERLDLVVTEAGVIECAPPRTWRN
jgi:5-formyltetrahydrofolate cyclo-ligase